MSKFSAVFLSLFLLVLLTACTTPIVPPTPVPTAVPPKPTPTQPAPTRQPTAAPTQTVVPTAEPTIPLPQTVAEAKTDGVSFFYDPALILSYRVQNLPAQSGLYGLSVQAPSTLFYGVPDFVQFTLITASNKTYPALLTIQQMRDQDGNIHSGYPSDASTLTSFLEVEQRLADTSTNAASQFKLVDFSNGRGFRYVTTSDQQADGDLYYNYEGVTDSGQYFVSLQYPIDTDTAAQSALTNSDFTPDLRRLDLMMETLFVAPNASTESSIPANEAGCINDSQFIDDITIPDGTPTEPSTTFTKTWRIRNTGTCTWSAGYTFQQPETPPVVTPFRVDNFTIPVVPPGGEVELSVTLLAPPISGYYRSEWQLAAPSGNDEDTSMLFGRIFYTEITVNRAAGVTIPSGEWVVVGSEPREYVMFAPDSITYNGQTCTDVTYSGRFILSGEFADFNALLEEDVTSSGRRYLELIRTTCDLPGFDQFIWTNNPYTPAWITPYNEQTWIQRLSAQSIPQSPTAKLIVRLAENEFAELSPDN